MPRSSVFSDIRSKEWKAVIMDISERLTRLRSAMKAHGIDMYYIPSDDFHGSEYVGEYFRCREYISGFTGSAGTVIVTAEQAGLWTDGRYFLQEIGRAHV